MYLTSIWIFGMAIIYFFVHHITFSGPSIIFSSLDRYLHKPSKSVYDEPKQLRMSELMVPAFSMFKDLLLLKRDHFSNIGS